VTACCLYRTRGVGTQQVSRPCTILFPQEVTILTQDLFVQAKIVDIAWQFLQKYEVGGHLGGQMIMHTLANRVRLGWGTWLSVLDRVPTFMAEKEMPKAAYPTIWEPNFIKLLQAVDGVYSGSTQDLSKGALYFGVLGKIDNKWYQEKIIDAQQEDHNGTLVRVHPIVANMGALSFWR